jgi:hypothetical protein
MNIIMTLLWNNTKSEDFAAGLHIFEMKFISL